MMKHLLSGIALAALLTAGLPVMAQTSNDKGKPAAAQSGTAATGASTSMPADTDARQSGSTTSPSADRSTGPAKKSKAPAAADAQSGTTATGAKSSTAAETNSARSGTSMSPQSGTTTSSDSMDKSAKSAKGGKHEASASDHMAEQLNKQELQRVESGGGQPTTGSSQPPAATGTSSAGGNQGSGTGGAH